MCHQDWGSQDLEGPIATAFSPLANKDQADGNCTDAGQMPALGSGHGEETGQTVNLALKVQKMASNNDPEAVLNAFKLLPRQLAGPSHSGWPCEASPADHYRQLM